MYDMVMEISNTPNTTMKAFHIEAFKKDSLWEEGTDLNLGQILICGETFVVGDN